MIRKMNNALSPGLHNLKSEHLKGIAQAVAAPLICVFNITYRTGICLEAFKLAVVTPTFKNGKKLDFINSRPVSIIFNFRKNI